MPSFTVFKGTKDGFPQQTTTTRPDQLTGDQVLVKITASGLCGTDLHYKNAGIVLGHEGVGIVEQLGPDAKFLKKGDRVGWGYQHDCCGNCQYCLSGEEIFCNNRVMYGEGNQDQGSFGSHAVWREAFLHSLPDKLSDEDAAPLQCGGATVYTALQNARSDETIGVMGMGGLGHLAIQFANKMGCRVVVLSGSNSKKEEALRLGAHEFVAMKEGKTKLEQPLNRLVVTTSANPDWSALLDMLAPKAIIYPLSVDSGNFQIPHMALLAKGITIVGSLVATRHVHRDMLRFAANHDIKPVKEVFPMTEEGIKDAMTKLDEGKVHFRAVLVPQ